MITLHQHPFASFCQKVTTAFYELGVPFETVLVEGREEHVKLWPLNTIPVLVDGDLVLPESTTIIEYVDDGRLLPGLLARLWDRLADNHLERPMQKIVTDSLRAPGEHDAVGVAEARAQLDTAYDVFDRRLASHRWLAGDTFTIADCAAAPALFYCRAVHPWTGRPNLTRYQQATREHPAFARAVEDGRPFRGVFPLPWPADLD
ncbi:MAG TPA: glutathione S-transferase family protein [Solirubrobacter sp.]|nr:glutathione S-transferase family protein [Solirubrobacter sp.]